ncbi:SWIM zinc finger family protein [Nocardioides zeae]
MTTPEAADAPAERWPLERVRAAAPDAASLAAARRLTAPGPWSDCGVSATLVWGKCQGSGGAPYQVSVDLAGPAYRCSCPSRKFPCKHALALLMRWSAGDLEPGAAGAPDEAAAWARQRAERAAARASAEGEAPVDPAALAARAEAAAKRREERLARMDAGVEEFAVWLTDLARTGIAAARQRDLTWWESTAARLVDAQLPGVAEEVRALGRTVRHRPDWAEHTVDTLGRWWLLVRAWRRRAALDEATAADLRTDVGWAWPTDEVRAGETVTDVWAVLGAHRSTDGGLLEQRTWLHGERSGRVVQVLDFAARGAPVPVARTVGSRLDATLALYPGHDPRRALLVTDPVAAGDVDRLPTGGDLATARARRTAALAANPFVRRVPAVVADARVVPAPDAATTGAVSVVDAVGRSVPGVATGADEEATVGAVWSLLARTGGHPADLFGELEGGVLRVLAVGTRDGVVGL